MTGCVWGVYISIFFLCVSESWPRSGRPHHHRRAWKGHRLLQALHDPGDQHHVPSPPGEFASCGHCFTHTCTQTHPLRANYQALVKFVDIQQQAVEPWLMAGEEPLSHLDCRLYFFRFGLISPTNFTAFPSDLSVFYLSAPALPPWKRYLWGSRTPFFLPSSTPVRFLSLDSIRCFLPSCTQPETSPEQLSCPALFALIISKKTFDFELCVAWHNLWRVLPTAKRTSPHLAAHFCSRYLDELGFCSSNTHTRAPHGIFRISFGFVLFR